MLETSYQNKESETKMKILETERLLLRHLVLDDLPELFALYRDPEIRKYFPEGVQTLEETKEEMEWHMHGHSRFPELGLWATVHKETGKFIGRCGLLPWEIEGQHETEIAYLLDKAFWHQGLATEAARGILEYGFENLKLSRLICMIDPENLPSQRVAERIGMTFEKRVEEYEGEPLPFFIYSIHKK